MVKGHAWRAASSLRDQRIDPLKGCRALGIVPRAEVAEIADTPNSKSGSRKRVWVRVPASAGPAITLLFSFALSFLVLS